MGDIYDNLDQVTNPTACCVRDYYKKREAELLERLAGLTGEACISVSKLEATEARIKASQKQEPCAWSYGVSAGDMHGITLYKDNPELEPLYARPVITPELAELQREIETLRSAMDAKVTICGDEQLGALKRENTELRKLLEESKVPEGWQLVPKEPNSKMLDEICLVDEFTYTALSERYKAMLAAAPQPKEPKQ